jgi:hypothetical protein
VDGGLSFVRRRHEAGHHYFVANLSARAVDGWVRLGVQSQTVVTLDPLDGGTGVLPLRDGREVYLQLPSGKALILRTMEEGRGGILRSAQNDSVMLPLVEQGAALRLEGEWQVEFIEGGPSLPGGFTTRELGSWTTREDARAFAGTARYSLRFALPDTRADEWRLELGRVCESARVRVNGQGVGCVWAHPFSVLVGKWLRAGQNVLEIEVTNLAANRVADLDRRGVRWKRFHEINFVDIQYKSFDASQWPLMDSGLLGPVTLHALKRFKLAG